MTNPSVSYSRAGDAFHYRWAARRCLRLLYPDTILNHIVIEGSMEREKAGEYVIDVSEYFKTADGNKSIAYYQLKHTTVRGGQPMKLGDLKDTLTGFANRYRQHQSNARKEPAAISLHIITNRKVDGGFKEKLIAFANRQTVDKRFLSTLEKYTKLKGRPLAQFCALIDIEDSEGDYNVQNAELKTELSQLVAGTISQEQLRSLAGMVQEKILPDSDNVVTREDVLKQFHITSERDLFPAPPLWEKMDNVIEREQHNELISQITASQNPVIVHAAGGVGKTVFCRQLVNTIPAYSLAIAYDCFGTGSYRNRATQRHRYRDALVQIANELATKGLCQPLIVFDTTLDDAILRSFLERIGTAASALKKTNSHALLYIVIDAADNAEMAAGQFADNCFVHELLRETMPKGCRLIMLCRTERRHLLQPGASVLDLPLMPFSETESLQNLRSHFPEATPIDGLEFHRLTDSNPRVQANALAVSYKTLIELLACFGPTVTTVEMQIQAQLQSAVSKITEDQTPVFQQSISALCIGLASLPPHIPIDILAKAADVPVEAIKSFVADMGRPLWISDSSVQFRDEPTETWFRETFLAKKESYISYIERLEPLAATFTYVAEVLPQLYLETDEYAKLISIALSDELLPENNPIDARNVRIFRLRFAFVAALKSQKNKDAVQLAMRAGEEVAGSKRQFYLFRENPDLLTALQDKEKIQEIAYKTKLRSGWEGSENIYTASLLCGIAEFKGEARGFLRAAENWLSIYFKKKKKAKEEDQYAEEEEKLSHHDLVEFAYAHLSIHGVERSVEFINHITPKEYMYTVVLLLARRLVDTGRAAILEQYAEHLKNEPYYVIAIAHELIQVGKFLNKQVIENCLKKICNPKTRIKKPEYYFHDDMIMPGVMSFIESCLHHKTDKKLIFSALDHYVPERASRGITSQHSSKERIIFLKALSIRMILSGQTEIDVLSIIPKELLTKKDTHEKENEIKEYKEVVDCLLPWFTLRAEVLHGNGTAFRDNLTTTASLSQKAGTHRYRTYDPHPKEIAQVVVATIVLPDCSDAVSGYQYLQSLEGDFAIEARISLLRAAYHNNHLSSICDPLEANTYDLIQSITEEGPDEISEKYISLSRAVVGYSIADAAVYFNKAVDIVSKFGEELVRRWEALEALADQASKTEKITDEFAYRFIRCAELVGRYVSREKHWGRSNAARVAARLSPSTALAAISRWRDRDVGNYSYQLLSIMDELVTKDIIPAAWGWSISHFFESRLDHGFATLCLAHEPDTKCKQAILDDAIRILQVEGAYPLYTRELHESAVMFALKNTALETGFNFHGHEEQPKRDGEESYSSYKKRNDLPDPEWDIFFEQIELDTPKGLQQLFNRKKDHFPKNRFNRFGVRDLTLEALARIKQTQVLKFLNAVLVSDDLDVYVMTAVLYAVPDTWKNKPSFREKWPEVIKMFGRQNAHELTNDYTFDRTVKELQLDASVTIQLKIGIHEGLQNEHGLTDDKTFFGFCNLSAPNLTPEDALDLTDYALQRFELHMEEDLGDGPYREIVTVDKNLSKSIAGFIWSALGSPRSWLRWNAAHVIRTMGQHGCTEVIDAIFGWMEKDAVGAYGSPEYVFYNLHAKQYFLIALARLSKDHPGMLLNHSEQIGGCILNTTHVLIQKFARDVALNIEAAFPGTYDQPSLSVITQTGKSRFEILKADYHYETQTPWHQKNQIEDSDKFHFGWDFDRYWYQPLAGVFGISSQQVEDLAADTIIKDWELGNLNGYQKDPRVRLWNMSSSDKETWHDHGSYPRTDRMDFYLSYHAMMVVAAKLIASMPVVEKHDWNVDPWEEWLTGHMLTIEDGRWLSDIRDPLPLKRPKWTEQQRTESWPNEITDEDFRKALATKHGNDIWINVRASWHEKVSERKESISIVSAFVAKETSDALLRALQTCIDPHDFKLPYYQERDMEFENGKFVLKGWIEERSGSKGLDQFDTESAEVSYPSFTIGEGVLQDLDLLQTRNTWQQTGNNTAVLQCTNWSSNKKDRDDYPDQQGIKLSARLSFLQDACRKYNCDMIIEVTIERDIIVSRMGRSNGYGKPIIKILILSADGTIRTTEGNFRIG